jgi:hypothetical protein
MESRQIRQAPDESTVTSRMGRTKFVNCGGGRSAPRTTLERKMT